MRRLVVTEHKSHACGATKATKWHTAKDTKSGQSIVIESPEDIAHAARQIAADYGMTVAELVWGEGEGGEPYGNGDCCESDSRPDLGSKVRRVDSIGSTRKCISTDLELDTPLPDSWKGRRVFIHVRVGGHTFHGVVLGDSRFISIRPDRVPPYDFDYVCKRLSPGDYITIHDQNEDARTGNRRDLDAEREQGAGTGIYTGQVMGWPDGNYRRVGDTRSLGVVENGRGLFRFFDGSWDLMTVVEYEWIRTGDLDKSVLFGDPKSNTEGRQ